MCGADPVESDDVLDLLSSLVQKSLVLAEDTEDGTRYRVPAETTISTAVDPAGGRGTKPPRYRPSSIRV